MNRLAIIGAGGHGKVIADIARLNGYTNIVFLDDDLNIKECSGYPIIGKCELAETIEADIIVGIGNPEIRKIIQENVSSHKLVTLVHPNAVVAKGVDIGAGTVVMAGVVVNPGARIGCGCIINTCSSIDHDCKIGNYVHVAVGSHICGTVVIGDETWVGAGATISNNVNITDQCIIGAGAVVIKTIDEQGMYIGVPAKNYAK